MKRAVYIAAFVVFGLLAQFLVHAALEMITIELLTSDYSRYGLGLTWAQWFGVHRVMTVALFAAGAWLGYQGGLKWWKIIYVEKRFGHAPRSLGGVGWSPKWKR